jgi:uncharacterized protein (DUF1778 family)
MRSLGDKKRLIQFSDVADQTISDAAAKLGLSFSAFCRSASLEKASNIVEPKQPAAD